MPGPLRFIEAIDEQERCKFPLALRADLETARYRCAQHAFADEWLDRRGSAQSASSAMHSSGRSQRRFLKLCQRLQHLTAKTPNHGAGDPELNVQKRRCANSIQTEYWIRATCRTRNS